MESKKERTDYFYKLSIADGLLNDYYNPESQHKALVILTEIMITKNIEKKIHSEVFTKIINAYLKCPNNTRFLINNLIAKYKHIFQDIVIKKEMIGIVMQLLNFTNSIPKCYILELVLILPQFLDNKINLVHRLYETLIKEDDGNEEEKLMIIKIIGNKLNKNQVFINLLIDNLEKIMNSFAYSKKLKYEFLLLFKNNIFWSDGTIKILFNYFNKYKNNEYFTILSFILSLVYSRDTNLIKDYIVQSQIEKENNNNAMKSILYLFNLINYDNTLYSYIINNLNEYILSFNDNQDKLFNIEIITKYYTKKLNFNQIYQIKFKQLLKIILDILLIYKQENHTLNANKIKMFLNCFRIDTKNEYILTKYNLFYINNILKLLKNDEDSKQNFILFLKKIFDLIDFNNIDIAIDFINYIKNIDLTNKDHTFMDNILLNKYKKVNENIRKKILKEGMKNQVILLYNRIIRF
jgi:hypothetical protein